MQPTEAKKLIAALFALAGFAVACWTSLSVGKAALDGLINAMLSMIVCHWMGLIAGEIGEWTVREHVKRIGNPTNHQQRGTSPMTSES
jgi:hypothetical protein